MLNILLIILLIVLIYQLVFMKDHEHFQPQDTIGNLLIGQMIQDGTIVNPRIKAKYEENLEKDEGLQYGNEFIKYIDAIKSGHQPNYNNVEPEPVITIATEAEPVLTTTEAEPVPTTTEAEPAPTTTETEPEVEEEYNDDDEAEPTLFTTNSSSFISDLSTTGTPLDIVTTLPPAFTTTLPPQPTNISGNNVPSTTSSQPMTISL